MDGLIIEYRMNGGTGRAARDPDTEPATGAGCKKGADGNFRSQDRRFWAGVEPNVRQFPLADRHDCRVPFGVKRSARPGEGRAEAGGGQNLARSPTEVTRPSGFDTKPLYPNAPPMMPAVLPL